ncbi:hypothetical protein CPB83DRAFT_245616 [Crepidotus variabilis]|uniref:Lysine-specific metallo-endopeptidase domain-containing protein n=1 Tax=Crepidotus variabilis TaxID=179855 RepID=A0A9P6JHR2_9AGAR|nr:hypothetical protein CPB83DRAFT_245616 [Crepidotus variabilis]
MTHPKFGIKELSEETISPVAGRSPTQRKQPLVQVIMLSFYRLSILLALVQAVLSTPLGITYDKPAVGAATIANKQRLDDATTLANTQITHMRSGIDKAIAGEPKALALYEAAFGKAGTNSDMTKVQDTVQALQTGTIHAKVAAFPFRNGEIASVPWTENKAANTWDAGPARFGSAFHDTTNMDANGRAGTVIHEATHQLKKTGDAVDKTTGAILRADQDDKNAHPIDNVSGYTNAPNMHKKVADVTKDKKFTAVRNSAPNMHDNAESYAVFASLCSQPGALRRRDLHLFNRALVEGDDEQLEYLSRRNSCQLPPNYFAKKKAAAAAKAGVPTKTDASSKNLKASTPNAAPKLRTAVGKVSKANKVTNALKPGRGSKTSTKSVVGGKKVATTGSRSAKSKALSSARKTTKISKSSKIPKKSATKARSVKSLSRAKAVTRKPTKASTSAKKLTKARSAKTPSRGKAVGSRKSLKSIRPSKKSATKAKVPRNKVAGARKSLKTAKTSKKSVSKVRTAKTARGKVATRKPVKSTRPSKKLSSKSRSAKAPSRKATGSRKTNKLSSKSTKTSRGKVTNARTAVKAVRPAKKLATKARAGKALSRSKVGARKPIKAVKGAKSTKARSVKTPRGKVASARKSSKVARPSKKLATKAKTPSRGKTAGGRKPVKAARPSKKLATKARSTKSASRAVARKPVKASTKKSTVKARPATRGKVVQSRKASKPVRSTKPRVGAKAAPKVRAAAKGTKAKTPARARSAAKPKAAKPPVKAARGRAAPKAKPQARAKIAPKAKVAAKVTKKVAPKAATKAAAKPKAAVKPKAVVKPKAAARPAPAKGKKH